MSEETRLPVSVVVLTLNEERHLPACLASVARADDVVVLDSGSTDRTVEIARAAGARVFTHPFEGFAAQRNHAQTQIPFQHPWVFHLDADEQMLPELLNACAAVPASAPLDGYYAAPRMMFHGRWLRHCTDYPAWQARFVRAPQFRFIQVGHGQREAPDMRMGRLSGDYLHDISVPDLAEWDRRHHRYAREEALRHRSEPGILFTWSAWHKASPLERRRLLKHLSYTLPFRPSLRFIYQYLLRGGLLDGSGAFRYCRLLARYERYAVEELRRLSPNHS